MTMQKFEKELTTVKGEIQSCRSEARKAKDNHTQSLTSIQAKLTTSQLVSQHEEGKVLRKLTQLIENLKRNLQRQRNILTKSSHVLKEMLQHLEKKWRKVKKNLN